MEKELAALGVASTLTDTARRVMERSAEQAGFHEAGRDRLVMPGFVPSESPTVDAANDQNGGGNGTGSGSGEGTGLDLDPLLIALLKKIPSAEKGWPAQTRLQWFRTFVMNVSQIYDADENDPVEMNVVLEKKEAAN